MVYDIEFLLKDLVAPPFALYVYWPQSGILRRSVVSKVAACAEKSGYTLVTPAKISPVQNLFDGGLLELAGDSYPIVDASAFSNAHRARIYADFIDNPGKKPRLLLMPLGQIPAVSPEGCIRIEEPLVDAKTIDLVLTFFENSTDLFDFALLRNKTEFHATVREYIEEESFYLHSFLQYLEELTLSSIDPDSQMFDARAQQAFAHADTGIRSIPLLTQELIAGADDWTLKRLIMAVDQRLNRRRSSARAVLTAIQRGTTKSLTQTAENRETVLCWTAILILRERELLEGNFVLALYKLCREFQTAKRSAKILPPTLSSRLNVLAEWIEEALRHDEASVSYLLAQTLVEATFRIEKEAPSWIQSLRNICAYTIKIAAVASADAGASPVNFASEK